MASVGHELYDVAQFLPVLDTNCMACPNCGLCWTRIVWRGQIVAFVGHELYGVAESWPLLDTNCIAWPNCCLCWTRTVWRGPIVAFVGHELYCLAQLLPLFDTNCIASPNCCLCCWTRRSFGLLNTNFMTWPNRGLCWTRIVLRRPIVASVRHESYVVAPNPHRWCYR